MAATGIKDVEAIAKVSKESLEALKSMVKLYNDQLDKTIGWEVFQETMDKMNKYKDQFSKPAGEILGRVTTLLMNSKDQYQTSVRQVYEWCQLAMLLLPGYKEVLISKDKDSMESQKELLVAVLEDGIAKMTSAIAALGESSTSFNTCAGELVALNIQLNNDFKQGSSYFEDQVDTLRKTAYGSAAVGVILGPFGLIISYSVAAGVVEGELIPKMIARFNEVKAAFEESAKLVEKANMDIDNAKAQLDTEITKVSDLKVKAIGFHKYVTLTTPIISMLKKTADDLMTACTAYMDMHGGSHM